MAEDLVMEEFRTAKTRLQSFTDENDYERPVYESVSKRIDDFRKIYKVRVTIEGLVDSTGEGYSRRLAEYRAAINAWNEIAEVRNEQTKSKAEQQLAKDMKNGVNNSNDDVPNDSAGSISMSDIDSAPQLNGHHNSDANGCDNDVNPNNNSIIISADINTSVEDQEKVNLRQVNGISDEQSPGSSGGSAHNETNGCNVDSSPKNGTGSNSIQLNGSSKRSQFMSSTSVRTFQAIHKSSVQQLHDFCVFRQSPYPFYDTTYKDRTFLIKCRIEFTEDEEKREFFGTGTGNTSKEAKLMAAEDIVQQLDALGLM